MLVNHQCHVVPQITPLKRSTAAIPRLLGTLGILCSLLASPLSLAQSTGVSDKSIAVGSLLPLEGDRQEAGTALKAGLDAALNGLSIQGRRVELNAVNDFYDPAKATEAAKKLATQGVFLMIGNHGTPTVKAALPVLAENKIPLLGPYTGAALTGPGDVLNFRTSYIKEVESVIDLALAAGIKPTEICGYVQNDSYGMSGVAGIRAALSRQSSAGPIVAKLDEILNLSGDNPVRDNLGPIGVYQRETTAARNGYQSLKKWEETNKSHYRLVVTVGVFDAVAPFIQYAQAKGETWAFSMVSFTGVPTGIRPREQSMTSRLIQTHVVPPLDSALPIAEDARKALGVKLNDASFEGYIVGRLFGAIALATEGAFNRENFLKAARRQAYDLGGVKVDFTNGKNPGFDGVFLSYSKDGALFAPAKPGDLEALLK